MIDLDYLKSIYKTTEPVNPELSRMADEIIGDYDVFYPDKVDGSDPGLFIYLFNGTAIYKVESTYGTIRIIEYRGAVKERGLIINSKTNTTDVSIRLEGHSQLKLTGIGLNGQRLTRIYTNKILKME